MKEGIKERTMKRGREREREIVNLVPLRFGVNAS